MTVAVERRGRFITLEGGEGAGKSTQLPRLADALRAAGKAVLVTREPGGTGNAETIRRLLVSGETDAWLPMTEALLHFAARAEHVERVILPAIAAGTWVISDRFADSTMAYQGYGHRLGRAPVLALYRTVVGRFRPDLTLVFDVPVAEGLARASARRGAEDRYERMDRAFHERLRRGFRDIARREPRRCALIDATRPPDAVTARMLACVGQRLKLGAGFGRKQAR